MRSHTPSYRGFTIVELLVVVAVIGVLMALVLAGLRGAMSTSRKTVEMNAIRGYFFAWSQYHTAYDALLPGYLDEQTQQAWNVTYKNVRGDTLARSLSQTYPWRLRHYFDSVSTLIEYRGGPEVDVDADAASDWIPQPDSLPSWMQPMFSLPGSAVALQPAFGYNAYYLGGWYRDTGGISVPDFLDASWENAQGATLRGRVVAQRLSQITYPAEMLVFTSSTFRPANLRGYSAGTPEEDNAPGSAWVVPSYLGDTQVWAVGMGTGVNTAGATAGPLGTIAAMLAPVPAAPQSSTGSMVVYTDQSVPLRRYNRQSTVVTVDGAVSNAGDGQLQNMQHWVNSAWRPAFRHGQ